MSRQSGLAPRLARIIVAVAARLAPAGRRSEWRREWEGELWAAAEAGRPVLRPALGAVPHALWLRGRAVRSGMGRAAPPSAAWLGGLGLDLKLGLRTLVKYPGLSFVSVLGMAVAIAIGSGAFGAIYTMADPDLPLPDGERVVSLQNTNTRNPGNPHRQSLHDFMLWRAELESVRDVGAFRSDARNLIIDGGTPVLVRIAEMSAAGFRVAAVPPVLGRPLVDDDEREGAPPVLVIAYEEWQRRFEGDPGILGAPVRLGGTVYTVVGVMPEGFRFPLHHRYWIPLRLNPMDYPPGDGPIINIFGRLAEGATMEGARTELTTLGRRMAAAHPRSHGHLRAQLLPYAHPFFDLDTPFMMWALHLLQLTISLLLLVVAVNVAVLVYARTATRAGEIAVRTALGASRRRIVVQLFVEALVLSLVAAALGLTVAGIALSRANEVLERIIPDQLPFWVDFGLSAGVVVYTVGLAVVAGVVVGVVPALQATRRRIHHGLQQLSSRGSSMQLGRTWTALIVVQVAIAVAILPSAIDYATQSARFETGDPGYPADEFLRGIVSMEREEVPPAGERAALEAAFPGRFADRVAELVRRLEADPAVAGVTFASDYPGGGRWTPVEVETAATPEGPGEGEGGVYGALVNRVDPGLFEVFDVPILAGRGFVDADAREGATAVIVNRALADRIGAGGNVLGRRVRVIVRGEYGSGTPDEAGPWLEIVGVVPTFPAPPFHSAPLPVLFHAMTPAHDQAFAYRAASVTLAVRVRDGSPSAFANRLRETTAAVDPTLQLHELWSVPELRRQSQRGMRWAALGIAVVTLVVLLLSAAGIYAMMSFTVAKRWREIGIRAALGAQPGRVLSGIFARACKQLGIGVLCGLAAAAALNWAMPADLWVSDALVLLPGVAALMMAVGLLAALGPARRGLRVQPTEAMREE